ncbi:MAG: hypothetical protein ABIQ66_02265 [Novosphingobium sp.]
MRVMFRAVLALLVAGLTGCHKADDYNSRYDKVAQDIQARQRAIEQDIGKESQSPDDLASGTSRLD